MILGLKYDSSRPATTTASTPLACTTSASRNAANGVSTLNAPSRSGSSSRRRISTTTRPTASPATIPPPAEPTNRPRNPSTPGATPPTINPTVTENSTSAVPSLTRLSARNVVRMRRGIRFARPATAAASVGASTAPSTQAACGLIPSALATSATATIVTTTSATASEAITSRFDRISRRLITRLSR